MLTEAQAKEKWCPFARVAEPWRWANSGEPQHPASVNRGSDALLEAGNLGTRCLGSGCMAWRSTALIVPRDQAVDDSAREPHGFCGLAGAERPFYTIRDGAVVRA
jgi:hypothetical protein